ncbi:MAG TPA: hypothetical protein VF136_00160 [Methylomirabilota bacterium]
MIAGRGRVWPVVLVVFGLIGGAAGLQAARDRTWTTLARPTDTLYLRSGKALDRLALSFDALLADIYWIRAVQYFGRTRLSDAPDKRYDDLYPLLDLTTTLDPQFNIAYRFGAIFLSEGYPNGPGRPRDAIALLQKGYAVTPHRWQYLHDIGFVYYWWLEDYRQAASWFERASRIEGAPDWLGPLAAVTLARGGDRGSSRVLWLQLLETAEHDYLRRAAEHRLVQLDIMDELDRVNAVLERFSRATGAPATSWEPLVAGGWLLRVPAAPDGVPFEIDSSTGRASLPRESRYFPLPGQEGVLPDFPRARPGAHP